MQIYPRILPSFTLALTTKSDSPDLPDYYRSTREEVYGPSNRSSGQSVDLMKTIDLRSRESGDYNCSFLLSDAFAGNDDDVTTVFEDYGLQRHTSFTQSSEKLSPSSTAWCTLTVFWCNLTSRIRRLYCVNDTSSNFDVN